MSHECSCGLWRGALGGCFGWGASGTVGVVDPDGAALSVDPILGEEAQGLRIESVFDLADTVGQFVGGVVGVHGHRLLQDHGPVVVLLVDEVDGDAGPVHAVLDHGAMDVHAIHAFPAEGGEESRVDIRHAAPVCLNHVGRDFLHVACESNERGVVGVQRVQKGTAKRSRGLEGGRRDDLGWHPMTVGPLQGAGVGGVAHAAHDLGWEVARVDLVQEGLEVGSAPGGKDGETHRADGGGR